MTSAFILYYLNMKPTHGYEIQKFLQISGTDQWAKIQSGSIYYALTKLEKDKYIRVLREERTGSRIRKVFEITESGKEELHKEMAEELNKPIAIIGSMKFFTDPMLSSLKREEIIKILENHINKLKEQQELWSRWYHVKVDDSATGLSRITFEMSLDSINYQIRWHQELLDHLDEYIKESKATEQLIQSINFDTIDESNYASEEEQKLQYALKLKNEILNDPQNAVSNLDKIINELQSQLQKK